jgi:hypothetical protein
LTADLILRGRVFNGDFREPRAQAVAVIRERIVAVGTDDDLRSMRGARTIVLGDQSCSVLPGFIDAHVHFLALARRELEVDCSIDTCPTVEALLAVLRAAAASRPAGSWILAFGYDEALLAEGRGPTKDELDGACPEHPLRLLHRTGHAALLNDQALGRLALRADRSVEVLYEPGEILRGRIPRIAAEELAAVCERASHRLLQSGITTIHDPTPGQAPSDVERLRWYSAKRHLHQRVRVYGSREAFAAAELRYGERLRVCGVKLVLTGEPDGEATAEEIAELDRAGAQLAVHAVEDAPLAVAIDGLRRLGRERVRDRRHRIEHASLCPPALVGELAASGATVVTHPDFFWRHAKKYRAELPPAARRWLFPLRSFLAKGVPVALGSDAPIAPPGALAAVAAAVRPRSYDEEARGAGEDGGHDESITVADALRLHTSAAARAGGDDDLGRLAPGALADVVVLEGDPFDAAAEDIATLRVQATILGGEVVWHRP